MDKDEFLILFACCFITKGASRSIIFDHQREELYFIPNRFADFLDNCLDSPLAKVRTQYQELISDEEFHEFEAFLEKNELCFRTSYPSKFPRIEKNFDYPALIGNAIIDVNSQSSHDYPRIFNQLDQVGCRDVQIRFYDFVDGNEIIKILDLVKSSHHLRSVELLLKFDPSLSKEFLFELTNHYIQIRNLILHSSPVDEIFKIYSKELRGGMGNIVFIQQQISSNQHCGIISQAYFNFGNIATYMESLHHNSCLNRKVGIDVDGTIKNCPSLPGSFGSIYHDSLQEICVIDEFQTMWNISKDQIDICKVCEFRNNCSDCRAFTANGDVYSKPSKCSYDPYSMSWLG